MREKRSGGKMGLSREIREVVVRWCKVVVWG
jgi:hypothetical protein